MRDQHLIYTDLEDGKIKVVPAPGYKMFCKLNKSYVSEAITSEKELKWFVSEAKEAI